MTTLRIALFSSAMLACTLATAQTTYRWLDKATGQTVFSDQPPPPGAIQVIKQNGNDLGTENVAPLPYATRLAAEKFPVTLYTAANCLDVCKQGRDLLNSRGIPFAEKILSSDEDIAELVKKTGSEASIPSILVGQQSFKGYESGAWNNLLDLAGYPKSAPYGSRTSGSFAR